MSSLNIQLFLLVVFIIHLSTGLDLNDENVCRGSAKRTISLNQTDFHFIELSWAYNIKDSTLTIDVKHDRTNRDEFIVVLGLVSSFNNESVSEEIVDKIKLNEFVYWCQVDENQTIYNKFDENSFQIAMQIDFNSLECKSIAVFFYENNGNTSTPIDSIKLNICSSQISCESNAKEKKTKSPFIHQFEINKFLPIMNFIDLRNQIYNPNSNDFRRLKKRDLNNDSIFERKIYETRFDEGNFDDVNHANLNEFFNRMDKIMLLRILKASRPVDIFEKEEVMKFTMRIIKASNLTLGSLEACITNFVKHIIMKSDEKAMDVVDIETKFDNSQLSHFQEHQENNYIDLSVNIKTESKFKVSSFFQTLQLIAIRPNKSQNIFIYGDLSLDLDLEMQLKNEYNEVYEKNINKYRPLWVIILIVVGGVLTGVYIGCIIAICHKRRPYQRANKIYEMEAVMRERLPKIPTMSFNIKSTEIASLQFNSPTNFK